MIYDFGSTCNRIRLTATGTLQPCLATPGTLSLRDRIRAGAVDAEIRTLVSEALWGKSLGHDFEVDGGGKRVYQAMSVTGG